MLSGVDDVTVEQDSEFEPLAGVSATDGVDGRRDRCRQGVRFGGRGETGRVRADVDKAGNTATAERTVTVKAKEGPTEPGKPTEPSDAEPTEPSELDDDKMEAPHGQHGGRQNQHGLFARRVAVSGRSCCWPSLAAWHSSAGGVVDGLVTGWPL